MIHSKSVWWASERENSLLTATRKERKKHQQFIQKVDFPFPSPRTILAPNYAEAVATWCSCCMCFALSRTAKKQHKKELLESFQLFREATRSTVTANNWIVFMHGDEVDAKSKTYEGNLAMCAVVVVVFPTFFPLRLSPAFSFSNTFCSVRCVLAFESARQAKESFRFFPCS